MKKYLILLIMVLFPIVANADEYCVGESPAEWCTGSSCLTNLQQTYNTWSTTGNTGKACIKVIAQRNGNSKTYLNGKNPNIDYKCANGNTPTISLVASDLPDQQVDVSECNTSTCYIPELWAVDCGDASNTSNSGNTDNSNNLNGTNNSTNVGSGNNNSGDVGTNSAGQITGTTDTTDTGVETYFIVLLVMVLVSYGIMLFVNKKNMFKSI